MSKIPVLVLAFNRADHVTSAMKAIREYKPERIYLECDGARSHKIGEKEAVDETRKAMLDSIDWPCEVKTLFRNENLGCANAVYGAISWFFENEEYGVICEDDIVLSPDFFRLCEELLPLYMDDERVMTIKAMNYINDQIETNEYCFGYSENCWGWATWRRAWRKMDMMMTGADTYPLSRLIPKMGLFRSLMLKHYWKHDVKKIKNNTNSSWATRWNYTVIKNNGFVISAKVNLAKNIGTDSGTHYEATDEDPYSKLPLGRIKWPLEHPLLIEINTKQKCRDNRDFFNVRMIGLKKKLKRMLL